MCCISDTPPDFQASRLSCHPLRSTQTESNCAVKLVCLKCHHHLVGLIQSAILFPRATLPAIRSPSADCPSVSEDHWEGCWSCPAMCVASRRREILLVRSVCVRRSTHTGQCATGLWWAWCLSEIKDLEWPQSAAVACWKPCWLLPFAKRSASVYRRVGESWDFKLNNALINKLKLVFIVMWLSLVR